MIINQLTLRVKNIIFFKLVSIAIVIGSLTYYYNMYSMKTVDLKAKLIKATKTLNEVENRLLVLKQNDASLNEAIELYKELDNNSDIDCFDSRIYKKQLNQISKKYKLKDKFKLHSSSSYKNNDLSKTVLLKTSTIKVNYHSHDFLTSIKIARDVYNRLPSYNFITEYEINRNEVLTPNVIKWLANSKNPEIISNKLLMEVKELELHE